MRLLNRIKALIVAAIVVTSFAWSPAAEAKFTFPYNHPDLDWYTIETEHFFVHYPVSKVTAEEGNEHYINAEYSARKTAKVSEEMWPKMCAEFNYFLKERIHIVVLDQADRLAGFTIPAWDWIEISANPGGSFYRTRGRMEWFSDVLVHEFAHVVSLKTSTPLSEGTNGINIGGLYSDGIRDADSGVSINAGSGEPWWWVEGGAEYWSDQTGYNWWSTSRDMNIRMTVLEDRLLTYDEWITTSDKRDWGDGERGYQQGYSMAQYIRERFGDETFARIAVEYGKGWRPDFGMVISDVLGISPRTLYEDWVAYITNKYNSKWDEVRAEGEVNGNELSLSSGGWNFNTPDARDEWFGKERSEREDERERTGTWYAEPRISPDGKWIGANNRAAVTVSQVPEDAYAALSGVSSSDSEVLKRSQRMSNAFYASFMHGWDFVPNQDALVLTGFEHSFENKRGSWTGLRFEGDGYDWNQLWYVNLTTKTCTDGDLEYDCLVDNDGYLKKRHQKTDAHPIPNTFRAVDPAVSPMGDRIVYFEYDDGTQNIVLIDIDGENKRYLTTYDDGTMFQRLDWSPDGTKIVYAMFRNYQQDLYIMDVESGEVSPITWDNHESMDAHWGWDGNIYFSSDPNGIFNVYRYHPETKRVTQISNVIGGALSPFLTPKGNLLFVNYTAHGWKGWGMNSSEFMLKDKTDQFTLTYDKDEVAASLAFSEDLTVYDNMTTQYKWSRALMPPAGGPIFRYSNDSQTNWGIDAGFWIYVQDFVEKHVLYVQAAFGEDTTLIGQYINQMWYPTFALVAVHANVKFDFGYSIDADGDYTTADDRTIFDGKNVQTYDVLGFSMFYPWNSRFSTGVGGQALAFGFKGISDIGYEPFMVKGSLSGFASYATISPYYARSANPRGGRTIDFGYTRGYTDIVYAAYYGIDVDDGQELDAYGFNRVDLRWTEQIAMRPLGSFDPLGLLNLASKHQHTLQVDVQGGVVDRNVQFNDEFRAGGRHPFFWGDGSLQPNTSFSGYPAASLSGETILLANVAYRFPVVKEIRKKVGPLFIGGLYGQVMGTAGNLWSYRVPEDPSLYYTNRFDARVLYDPSDAVREIPFKDYSYKNSPVDPLTGEINPNYLLYDAGAELRLESTIWNRASFASFLRLAYGFNEIRGVGDVNGDDIINTADSTLGDSLSNETELPGLRVYVGIGTGW